MVSSTSFYFWVPLARASLVRGCVDRRGVRRIEFEAMLCSRDFSKTVIRPGLVLPHHVYGYQSTFGVISAELDLLGLVLFKPRGILLHHCIVPLKLLHL